MARVARSFSYFVGYATGTDNCPNTQDPFLSTHLPYVLSRLIINLSTNSILSLLYAFIERNISIVYDYN